MFLLGGNRHRCNVNIHDIRDIIRVSSRHRHRNRQIQFPATTQNHAVAICQTLLGHCHASQPIVQVRVCAGKVYRKVWLESTECRVQPELQRIQIIGVDRAVVERDVEIAVNLAVGKIIRSVD